MTQADLAYHAHVKLRRIRRLEHAKTIRQVDMDILCRIADALDVPVWDFMKD